MWQKRKRLNYFQIHATTAPRQTRQSQGCSFYGAYGFRWRDSWTVVRRGLYLSREIATSAMEHRIDTCAKTFRLGSDWQKQTYSTNYKTPDYISHLHPRKSSGWWSVDSVWHDHSKTYNKQSLFQPLPSLQFQNISRRGLLGKTWPSLRNLGWKITDKMVEQPLRAILSDSTA